ncbi:MAG TPA: hypothetical protein VFV03_08525, partial [Solirubrobacteraceae bacterium]|nr:hypothetical protein [Solirubrobacteraceae bacterium]
AVLPPLPLALAAGAGSGVGATAGADAGSRTSAGVGTSAVGGATRTGWSPLAGPLGAKLAVTGLVVLGVGYALLGSRAHGSSPAHRPGPAPPALASQALLQVPHSAHRAPARGVNARSARRPSASHARPSRGGHPAGEAAAREFLPERARGETPAVPASRSAAQPSSPSGAPRTKGEFGFE